jgi:hypothetical protein
VIVDKDCRNLSIDVLLDRTSKEEIVTVYNDIIYSFTRMCNLAQMHISMNNIKSSDIKINDFYYCTYANMFYSIVATIKRNNNLTCRIKFGKIERVVDLIDILKICKNDRKRIAEFVIYPSKFMRFINRYMQLIFDKFKKSKYIDKYSVSGFLKEGVFHIHASFKADENNNKLFAYYTPASKSLKMHIKNNKFVNYSVEHRSKTLKDLDNKISVLLATSGLSDVIIKTEAILVI